MAKQARWNEILNLAREKESISVKELCKELKASEATIRRDLQEMEDLNLLTRYHGGAKIDQSQFNEPSMVIKSSRYKEEKKRIGLTAASLIKDNQMIYIDAGSTTYEIIPFIKAKNITVVTPGIPHMGLLGQSGINTIVLGGQLYWSTQAIIGKTAADQLESLFFDIAFIGANGIYEKSGFFTSNELEAMTKSKAIEHSQICYVVADSTKFNQLRSAKFASLDEAIIITNDVSDFNCKKIKYLLTDGSKNY